MKHLVLGSAGFIGKPFCEFLRGKGVEVIEYDVKRTWREDLRFVEKLPEADFTWFLAWEVGGAKWLYDATTQPRQYRWNSQLMEHTFACLEQSETPFLFVSSHMAEKADTIYGAQKRLGELVSLQLGAPVVRLWNVYGPMEEDTVRSHVVSDIVRQAKTRTIRLMTNGLEQRRFLHIDDVCEGLWLAKEGMGIMDLGGMK